MPVFRAKVGVVAIFEKPPSGDPMAPFDDPVGNLQYVKFHSDLQYLSNQITAGPIDITHTLLAGATGTGITVGNGSQNTNAAPVASGQIRQSSIALYTHGLGYVPLFQVINNNRIVSPGLVIQNPTSQFRMISAYATTTQIFLYELAISSASDLPSWDETYYINIFRNPEADPLLPTLHIQESGMVLAKGKVTDAHRPLRRMGSDDLTPFYLPIGRTVDIKNGAIRNISALAGIKDFGLYTGGFTSSEAIRVTY